MLTSCTESEYCGKTWSKHLCMYDLEYTLIEVIECVSTARL